MLTFNQSLSPAAKAHVESQFGLVSDFSKQLFGTLQRLNELNLQVAQTVWQECLVSSSNILSAQSPYEAFSTAAGNIHPAIERLRAYEQRVRDIAARTQADLAKTAEVRVPETARTATAAADEVVRKVSEETQKATQRQKAALDKVVNPLGTKSGGANTPNVH